MQYLKERAIAEIDSAKIFKFLTVAIAITVLPFFIHSQWLTGPIVNALLVIALFAVGIRSALFLCLLPSLMALAGGLIPAVLAPVVPFVMISNAIFVICIDRIYNFVKNSNYGYWLGIFSGAFLKFIFLFFSVSLITKLLLKQELAIKVVQMMSWPQFATALTGGMLAWLILCQIKKAE